MGDRSRKRADERRHEESLDEARRSRRWAAVGGVGTLAAIAVSITIAIAGGDGAATGDAPKGALELVDAVVVNRPFGDFAQIDIKLHNTSPHRVVLRRATITVERVERLTFCYTQGDLPVSGDYPIVLPTQPGTVEVPLNQQLGPDTADRITLSLTVPREVADYEHLPHAYVYRLHVVIAHDNADVPTDAGLFVVALPGVPNPVIWYWPRDLDGRTREELAGSFGLTFDYERYMGCWRPNTLRLRSVLSGPGERSDELRAVLDDLSTHPKSPTYAGS